MTEISQLAKNLWFPSDDPMLDRYPHFPPETRLEMIENQRAIEEQGRQAFIDGDAIGFLCTAGNTYAMQLVENNLLALAQRGIFEEALLDAITATRTNNRSTPLSAFRELFRWADRGKLLAAGDPLPGSGPFTLYRGVAGRTVRDHRVRGISWTGTLAKAAWFANRYPWLENREVYQAEVEAKHVLAYVGSHRNEDEYIVLLPRSVKVERVLLPLVTKEAAA